MKRVEILKLGRELLKVMSDNDLRIDDYRFVAMFYEYEFLRKEREKYNNAIDLLADKYKVSQSKVKRIIRRLEREVIL